MNKILINTGPSARGWHRLESHLRCPTLYSWGYGQTATNPDAAARFPPTAPLVRGSIGHAGLAHLYAMQREIVAGRDPSTYYSPLEAMRLVADTFGELGAAQLPVAARVVAAYAERYATERLTIVAIEEPIETSFLGWRYTARADLIWEDHAGKVWIVDHKIVSKIESKVISRYTMSGQVLGLIHLGARIYGTRFGGVRLNLLGVNPISFSRVSPDAAPWLLERFPEIVKHAEEGIAQTERLIELGKTVPAAPSEHTCFGSYGPCPAYDLCRWGVITMDVSDEPLDNLIDPV